VQEYELCDRFTFPPETVFPLLLHTYWGDLLRKAAEEKNTRQKDQSFRQWRDKQTAKPSVF